CEWLARQISDRELGPGWRGPLADHALHVDDPPYRAGIATRVRGRRVDLFVARTKLGACEKPKRGQPAVGLATNQAKHPWLERSHPDPDRVRRSRAGIGTIEPVVLPAIRH